MLREEGKDEFGISERERGSRKKGKMRIGRQEKEEKEGGGKSKRKEKTKRGHDK